MKTVRVCLKNNPYNIYIGVNIIKRLPGLLLKTETGKDACIITTRVVNRKHGQKLKKILSSSCASVTTLFIPDSEKSKNASLAIRLIEKITKLDKNKNLFLIAFGGGVVGDLTGFVASIYKRGIPYIQIPTTLLSQIDSSIGGKTAVDTRFGKNLVGAFYQPRFVLSDIDFLRTLPKDQIISGLAEAVKYAAIKDKKLFYLLEQEHFKILNLNTSTLQILITKCSTIKAQFVTKDEFDKKDIRIALNFGHTFAHAIETASNFKINHGQAVSIGMCCASELSQKLDLMKKQEVKRIVDLLKHIGLPTSINKTDIDSIIRAMEHDKKFIKGTNRFVLLEKVGKTKIVANIRLELIREILSQTFQ